MKNNILKLYIIAFYLCATFVTFAQTGPGSGSDNGGVDNDGTGDATPITPIDDYVWVLAVIGLFFVLLKFRAISQQRSLQK